MPVKIGITIQTKPDGYRGLTVAKMETLTLDTIAQPNGSGRWTSSSVYLGNKLSGSYDTRDPDYPGYPSFKKEPSPLGLFIDDVSTPFLVLEGFRSTKLAKHGWGNLIRVNREVATMEIEWQLI